MVEMHVRAHKLLHFILGECSRSFSCYELLQVECIYNELSRRCMIVHINATESMIFKVLCCMVESDNHLYMLYMQ